MQALGYLTSGAASLLFSGVLDALGSGQLRVGEVDFNNASGYPMAEVEYLCPVSGNAFVANSALAVWWLRSVSASGTYEKGSSGVTPSRPPDVVLPLNSGINAVARACRIPPNTFRALLKNDGAIAAMPASGNLVWIKPYSFQNSSG